MNSNQILPITFVFNVIGIEKGAPIDIFPHNGPYQRECRLIRTYMEDETTVNPITRVVFGEYTWEQKMANVSTLAIVVNASISSELSYQTRSITVKLGSEIQTQEFSIWSKPVEFEFGGLELKPDDYPLVINFSLIDPTVEHLFTVTNIVNGTVSTTIPSTPKPSMANGQFLFDSVYLVFSFVFLSFVVF